METKKAAEVFPPGEFIKEELEARNWTQTELAEIIGRQQGLISELVAGKRLISPDIAKELGAAFDTSAELWMNLENSYQLWRAKETDKAISQRAKIYQFAPVKELTKRHWIESSENPDVLAKRLAQFFEVKDLNSQIEFSHAARKKTEYISSSHFAWFYRAKRLSRAVYAKPFSDKSFKKGLDDLKALIPNAQDIRQVPRVLAEAGIRLLVVEHLPQTKIDGVTFWLDSKSPVIALSMRIDRIDGFWFTLAHELGHVARRDGLKSPVIFDNELIGNGEDSADIKADAEREADLFASEFLVHKSDLDNFILRVRPLYSKSKIINFAKRIEVHPAIIVGQLQHRKEIPYKFFQPMLEKVKHVIIQSALTDGWGQTPVLKEG
jgi:HTH-type transcriptional regulator / antitoxin HigA